MFLLNAKTLEKILYEIFNGHFYLKIIIESSYLFFKNQNVFNGIS
jgi:hypothetical protein